MSDEDVELLLAMAAEADNAVSKEEDGANAADNTGVPTTHTAPLEGETRGMMHSNISSMNILRCTDIPSLARNRDGRRGLQPAAGNGSRS